MATKAELRKVADKMAEELFELGSGPHPCRRIEFRGSIPEDAIDSSVETPQGGMSKNAMKEWFFQKLKSHLLA